MGVSTKRPGWILLALTSACGRIGFDGAPREDMDASEPDAIVTAGLIAHWHFEDDPNDTVAAALGPAASCVTTCPTQISGPRGGAYDFDGIENALFVGDELPFQIPLGSVAMWIRLDQPPPPGEFTSVIGKPFGTASANSWELYFQGAGATGNRLEGGGDSTANGGYAVSDWAVPLGAWSHIALTWGPEATLFVDGAIVARVPSFEISFDSHPLAIGADLSDTLWHRWFDGGIDDIRVYDRVLADAEIVALAQP